ncbi:hypothetical protein GH714_034268 [Hevea brasiliensis]|uniref:U-box domain-containing protein n=1 Tax=Hevea brasiliensis TaxID=3981 RepID=A0A6A6N640_HEVBR|nr:hypothetical protein GH714_034268 [Hevea brasiliensis]
MRDPVTVSTGQTTTAPASSPGFQPVTVRVLSLVLRHRFSLIPNHTLRRLIQDWCVANRAFGIERIRPPSSRRSPVCAIRLVPREADQAQSYFRGAADILIDRLADFDKCDAERALATIELLCRVPAGCAAFVEHSLTVPLLVKTILKISDRATEYAAGALLALCTESEQSQREAVSAGILTQLLLLVQSDCTDRAKRKAQMLLKLLLDSWPEDSGNSDNFVCSEVVP